MPDLHTPLLGTWKSDRRRTLATWHRYHLLRGPRKKQFASIFGKLTLRYTRHRVDYVLNKVRWSAPYEVMAHDADSVVLRIHSEDLWSPADPMIADIIKTLAQPRITYLHVTRYRGHDYHWIGCGIFCECFRRQEPGKPHRRSASSQAPGRAREINRRPL